MTPRSPDHQARPWSAVRVVHGLLGRGLDLVAGWRTTVAGPGRVPGRGVAGLAAEDQRVAGPGADGDEVSAQGAGPHSRWLDLDGPVHYLDFGGPARGPTVVCIHGLAGSAVNWSAIAPLLTGTCRMLAVDLPGHGLTRSQGRSTGIPAMHALLHRFLETVPASPVILAGNSMGGMISLLEASATPAAVAGVVLIDPVLPLVPAMPDHYVTPMLAAYAVPVLGPLLMRRRRHQSPQGLVDSILSLCCVDTSGVPADVLAQHVTVARHALLRPETEAEISATARSMIAIFAGDLLSGAYRRAIGSITCPVLLLHGTRDRLVPIAVARATARAHPAWTMIEMPGAGHVPQLEAPDATASAITSWLGNAGQPAAQAASPAPPPGFMKRQHPSRSARLMPPR